MKVSQELKDEFENLLLKPDVDINAAFNLILYRQNSQYEKLADFLFGNGGTEDNIERQLQFAKWWAGEEEIEVEEELYYLKLPFEEDREYIKLDPYDGKIFPSDKMERNRFQTKFTAEEIENNEKLRVFKQFAKRVDDDD